MLTNFIFKIFLSIFNLKPSFLKTLLKWFECLPPTLLSYVLLWAQQGLSGAWVFFTKTLSFHAVCSFIINPLYCWGSLHSYLCSLFWSSGTLCHSYATFEVIEVIPFLSTHSETQESQGCTNYLLHTSVLSVGPITAQVSSCLPIHDIISASPGLRQGSRSRASASETPWIFCLHPFPAFPLPNP